MKKLLLLLSCFFFASVAFAQTDLVITNTNNQDFFVPGTSAVYTVTVTNFGPVAATQVKVTSPIPSGITNFYWEGSNFSHGSSDLLNIVQTLAVGEVLTYTIHLDIPTGYAGPLQSTANVTTNPTDPPQTDINTLSNTAVDTDYIANADVTVTNTDGTNMYYAGQNSVYTLTVKNNGPTDAVHILVKNAVPIGIDPLNFSWTGSNGSFGTGVKLQDVIELLHSGESVVYTVTIAVPSDFAAIIINKATIFTTSTDPNENDNEVTDIDVKAVGSDIRIVNTDNKNFYIAGQPNYYTVTVTNAGPEVATNVAVFFPAPAGTTITNWSGNNTSGTNNLQDTIASLAVGATVTYTVSLDISAGFTGNLVTQVSATGDQQDLNPCTGCSDTDTAGADIQIVNTDNTTLYIPGSSQTYTVTVTNNGPDAAENVHVVNTFPAGVTTGSWTGSNGSNGGNALDDTIALLGNGESVTYTVNVNISGSFTGNLTSQVAVTSDTFDPVPVCSQCNDTDTQAVSAADISVINTDGSGTYNIGMINSKTYTVVVTNNGPADTKNIQLNYVIPTGATQVSWSGSNGTSGNGTINTMIGSLANGASVTYTITLQIPATFTGNFTTTANISTTFTTDSATANNTAQDADTPQNTANVVLVNTDSQDTYTAGNPNYYTVTVTNNGPSVATGINVSFPLPTNITSMSWTGNSTGGPGALNNTIPTLAVGQSIAYTVTVNIPAGFTGNLVAHAEIVSTTSIDPVTACPQCDDIDTDGTPMFDVAITNTDNQSFYVSNSTRVYTMTVTNNGPQSASQVHIENPLPAGTTMTWVANNSTNGSGAIDLIIPSLASGASIIYTITITIPAAFSGNLINTATVSTTPADSSAANNAATDTDTPAQSDIVVTNTAPNPTAPKGSVAQFIVTVTNNGPQSATAIPVSNPIPAGVGDMSWTGSNGTSGTGALADVVSSLQVGSSVTYTITFIVPNTATVTNTATASLGNDPNAANSQASATIIPSAVNNDASITITDNSAVYIAGQDREYTITVSNNGVTPISNINVSSIVPDGILVPGYNWTGNSTSGTGAINNIIGSLNGGQSVVYTLTYNVPSGFPQNENLNNIVSITAAADVNSNNNSATDTDTPTPKANLLVKKTDGKSTYQQSGVTDDKDDDTNLPIQRKEYVTYTITVMNYGPSDSNNVQVFDPIPTNTNVAGTQLAAANVEWSGNGNSGTGNLTDTIDHLAVGEIVTYTIKVYIPIGFQVYSTPQVDSNLINTVTVTSSTTDPVASNNSSTDVNTPGFRFLLVENTPQKYSVNGLDSGLAQGYVENVLVRSHCSETSNWKMHSGIGRTPKASIGYFNRNNSSFPIQEGIVLACTSNATDVTGPNNMGNTVSAGADWDSDDDGDLHSPNLQPNPINNNNLHNPVYMKFNFVPSAPKLSFNYIFAAEEYHNQSYECGFADIFAFILKDLTAGGPPVNLAVLPDGETAVTVMNVHRQTSACSALNAQYFGKYNFDTPQSPNDRPEGESPISINGQTKLLTAEGTVIPGHEYSIQLIIANSLDTAFISAVFIEAGSFKFDAEITGQGALAGINNFTGPNAVCDGQSVMLKYGESPLQNASYSWLLNGVKIDGATDHFYEATEEGTYTGVIKFATGCEKSDDIEVEFTDPLPTNPPKPEIKICAQSAPYVFDIDQTNYILNGFSSAIYPVGYYESEQDALDDANDLTFTTDLHNYTITDPDPNFHSKTIFVRIADMGTGSNCVNIIPVELIREYSQGQISYPAGQHCIDGGIVNVSQTTPFTSGGYYEATPSGLGIDFLTGAIDLDQSVTQPETYTIKYKIPGGTCPAYESQPVTFVVSACLVTVIAPRPAVCASDTFDLQTSPVNQPGVTYTWSDVNGIIATTNVPQLDLINAPSIAGSYQYTVVASTATESSPPSTLTLVVHPIPTATISGPNSVCTGDAAHVVISGTSGASVKYTDGSTETIVVIPNSGLYEFDTAGLTNPVSYQIIDIVGATAPPCSQTVTAGTAGSFLNISVGSPTAEITGPVNTNACAGDTVTIEIHGTPAGVVNYTGGTAGGGSVTLDAASGLGYIVQALNTTTTYTLTNINVAACGQTQPINGESITITVFQLPDASFAATTATVCESIDATLNFTGTPNATVNFHDSSNAPFNYVIPASGTGQMLVPASTYTLDNITSTDLCVSPLTQSVTIGVDLKPVITTEPVSPAAICEQESFSISVQATGTDLTYEWKHGAVTVQNGTLNTYTKNNATLADAGDYHVIVHGKCAPDALSVTVQAVINEGPHFATQPEAFPSLCPGNDLTLTVTTTATDASTFYDWRKGGQPFGAPNSNSLELINVTAADAGTYTVIVTNPGCPSITSNPSVVTVNADTVITAQPVASLAQCTGDTFQIMVGATGGALFYEWKHGAQIVQSGPSNTYTVTGATTADAGTYQVSVTGSCGTPQLSTTTEVTINVAPAFTLHPAAQTTLCSGQPLNLSVQASGTITFYQWKRNGVNVGTNSPNYNVSSTTAEDAGDYICIISNPTCPSVQSNIAEVIINPSPIITQQPVSQTVCVGEPINLIVAVTGNVTYRWQHDGADVGTDALYHVDVAQLDDAGTYRCIISSISCPDIYTNNVTVMVRPLPDATIANGSQSTICDNTGTDVIFTGTPNAIVTYTVNGGAEETITLNPSGSARLLTGVLGETTTYTLVSVSANDNPPCPKLLTGETVVTVMEIPDPELDQDGYICLDPLTGQTMTGSFYELNTGLSTADGYTFVWYQDDVVIPGASEGAYNAVAEGTYEVEITDTATGCTDSATAPIVTSTPPLTITADVVTGYFEENATVVVTATPAGDYEYRLDDGPWQTDNVFTGVRTVLSINTTGDHTVYVRDAKACDELSYDVKVIDYPKYFTPNGDGFHDTWNISVLSNQPNAKIYIFDRFGKLLKQISTTNPTGWDGTYNGQPMMADDYWFVVKYMEQGINKEFRAHFTLKR
jgi:large repetitive protein